MTLSLLGSYGLSLEGICVQFVSAAVRLRERVGAPAYLENGGENGRVVVEHPADLVGRKLGRGKGEQRGAAAARRRQGQRAASMTYLVDEHNGNVRTRHGFPEKLLQQRHVAGVSGTAALRRKAARVPPRAPTSSAPMVVCGVTTRKLRACFASTSPVPASRNPVTVSSSPMTAMSPRFSALDMGERTKYRVVASLAALKTCAGRKTRERPARSRRPRRRAGQASCACAQGKSGAAAAADAIRQ